MAFYEHRLPTDIEREAVGSAGFKTNVLAAISGFEQRNIDWSKIRGEWDLSSRFMRLVEDTPSVTTDLHTMRDLFIIQQGRAHGFRFKDHMDFEIGDYTDATNDNQLLALGDDATVIFQIFKQYSFGAQTYNRDIKKIVTARIVVLLDDVAQTDPGDYSVDLDTGLITFVVAPDSTTGGGPGGEQRVQVACEFDIPVRFDVDHLGLSLEPASLGIVGQIPIVELRLK